MIMISSAGIVNIGKENSSDVATVTLSRFAQSAEEEREEREGRVSFSRSPDRPLVWRARTGEE